MVVVKVTVVTKVTVKVIVKATLIVIVRVRDWVGVGEVIKVQVLIFILQEDE